MFKPYNGKKKSTICVCFFCIPLISLFAFGNQFQLPNRENCTESVYGKPIVIMSELYKQIFLWL